MVSWKCWFIAAAASLLIAGRGPAAPVPAPDTWMEVVLDRQAASASLRVERRAAFLLRADRDLTRVRVELAPSDGAKTAGRWRAQLLALPRTEQMDAPDLSRLSTGDTVWARTDNVPASKAFSFSLNLAVPRPAYQNWLLLVEPREEAGPVEVRLTGTAIDEAARVVWLTRMRLTYDPSRDPDRVRDLVRYLSDNEVRYWTGWPHREAFLQTWARSSGEETGRLYPGPEGVQFNQASRVLPIGVSLLTNTRRSPAPRPK